MKSRTSSSTDPVSSRATKLLALVLALLVLGALALGARCMSLTSVSCSPATLFGSAPELDVPYAGTRPEVVARMLDMARVGPSDRVVDLGTGDGRILIAAARDRGASGLGVDLDPVLIRQARADARSAGLAKRVEFRVEDLFETPLRDASVLAMFLLPEVNLKLRPRILAEMRPGSRVVSHAFDMGDWVPTATDRVGGSTIYLWVVPARVAGRWRLEEGGRTAELTFKQRFDRVDGRVATPDGPVLLQEVRLVGPRLTFTLPDGRRLEGIVEEDLIAGAGWQARRTGNVTPVPS